MPLYEYECQTCLHRFELIQRFSDPPPDACPNCKGAVKRLISSPAIQFKGTGWYITDYARADKGDASGSSRKDESAKSTDSGSTSQGSNSDSGGKTEKGPTE